jgi:diacylglycerol kinase family enzyme
MFTGLGDYFNNLVGAAETEAAKREAALLGERTGAEPINFALGDLNFDHLRRSRAFYKGVDIQMKSDTPETFEDLPQILPVKAGGGQKYASLAYEDLVKSTKPSEEQKTASSSEDASHLFDYDRAEQADKDELLSRLDVICKRKIDFTNEQKTPRGAAVIFNPNCRGPSQEQLDDDLWKAKVQHKLHVSNEPLGPFRLANEVLDLNEYGAIIIAGGDGTVSEVINGMLAREDGKSVPIGIVPTGQNNDIARSLGITDMEIAMNYITNSEAIGIDTTRVLLDCDDEANLAKDESRLRHVRHMLAGSSLSMPAKIASGAAGIKACCGSTSYSLSSFFQALTCGFTTDSYDIEIDDVKVSNDGTSLLCVNNGKHSNGGILNPFAVLNDGLVDITWIKDPNYMGYSGVTGVLSDARGGGI